VADGLFGIAFERLVSACQAPLTAAIGAIVVLASTMLLVSTMIGPRAAVMPVTVPVVALVVASVVAIDRKSVV
jgi:hypothetical protein